MLRLNQAKKLDGKEIQFADINVIVGKNNSGKSTFIKGLGGAIVGGNVPSQWFKSIQLEFKDVPAYFAKVFPQITSYDPISGAGQLTQNHSQALGTNPNSWSQFTLQYILEFADKKITYIDGSATHPALTILSSTATDILTCESRLAGPFQFTLNPTSDGLNDLVQYLYYEETIFKKVFKNIKSVFGIDLCFDDMIQNTKQIRLRPSREMPSGLTNLEKINFWRMNSSFLEQQGDGLKAYFLLISHIMLSHKDIICIDEPEIFLHPPQKRALAEVIISESRNKQIFISTHDGELLRAIIANANRESIKVIYIDKNSDEKLQEIRINEFSTRSENINEAILNSLFQRKTVLCEAEDDRTIYEFAARKYFAEASTDVNFVGLNGCNAVKVRYNSLKGIGVDAVCALDIDVLYEYKMEEFDGITDEEKLKIVNLRESLKSLESKSIFSRADFKTKGLTHLIEHSDIYAKAKEVIENLATHGIYVVQIGILESFTKTPKNTSKRIQSMLNVINSKKYIKHLRNFVKQLV